MKRNGGLESEEEEGSGVRKREIKGRDKEWSENRVIESEEWWREVRNWRCVNGVFRERKTKIDAENVEEADENEGWRRCTAVKTLDCGPQQFTTGGGDCYHCFAYSRWGMTTDLSLIHI